MTFQLDDYVDVPERIRLFNEKYPDGTLQGSGQFIRAALPDETTGLIVGYLYQAKAYRTPDDPRPGVGTAFEPIPGKTPYTRDSEVMNAETSAWGRAIVAVGIPSKRIASANEVASRQQPEQPVALPDESTKVTKAQHAKIGVLVKEWLDVLERNVETQGDPVGASRQFCVDRFGKHSRAELTKSEAGQLIDYLEEQVVLAQVPFG